MQISIPNTTIVKSDYVMKYATQWAKNVKLLVITCHCHCLKYVMNIVSPIISIYY